MFLENNNVKKDNPYKAWGIFVIVMNVLAAIYFVLTNKGIMVALNYYRTINDNLSLALILSPFIFLIFAFIEGFICIKASKDSKYLLAAFILIILDNIIYLVSQVLTFNPTNFVVPIFWIGFRFYVIYLAYGVLKNNKVESEEE